MAEAASEGALSKACGMLLDEQKLAELSPTTLEELRKLHPQAPLPPPAESGVSDPFQDSELTSKQIWRGLKRFKQLSAPGPSGLRVTHISEGLDTAVRQDRVDLLNSLICWVSASARGQLPLWSAPYICAARLVPFSKKAGGIRPVAVGEVLRRLCGKILLQIHTSSLVSALAPLQMGVGMKGATEAITRRLQRELSADRDLCVLQVDMSNAFNSVDRHTMLHRVHTVVPGLSVWAHFCYSQLSHLFVGDRTISSERGTQQGDPLGPAFVCACHSASNRIADATRRFALAVLVPGRRDTCPQRGCASASASPLVNRVLKVGA